MKYNSLKILSIQCTLFCIHEKEIFSLRPSSERVSRFIKLAFPNINLLFCCHFTRFITVSLLKYFFNFKYIKNH